MARKNKMRPMAWDEIRSVKFTTGQWGKINRYINLPDEGRLLIERMVSLYPFHKGNHENYQTPSAALSELDAMDKHARRLLSTLSRRSMRTHYALIDTVENADAQSKYRVWDERMETLKEISAAVQLASKDVRAQKRAKRGPKASAVDILVGQLDGLIRRYNKESMSRGKIFQGFVENILTIADPDIRPGTVDAAIKRVVKKRSL